MTQKFFVIIFFIASLESFAAEHKIVNINCQPTDKNLLYDCTISITGKKSQKPFVNALFTVDADMPSMPGAHSIKPVNAIEQKYPGHYKAKLQLEMYGEWAIRLNFTKPERDRVIKKLFFSR